MSAQLIRRKKALEDLVGHYAYFSELQPELAERFLEVVEASFSRLADHPRMGAILASDFPSLFRIRRWGIAGFRNYVILYSDSDDAETMREVVEIIRVLHGSRDLEAALMEDDTGEPAESLDEK